MAAKTETEKKDITGLGVANNRQEAEYDLTKALLESADFKTADETITKVDIKRAGKFMFSVSIHPISDPDTRLARKKATTYMPNPNGKKLPPIEKDFDNAKFSSWLIYLATTEEDQEKIWGNPALMQKYSLAQPWESVDKLLTLGEKRKLVDLVTDISGMDDDDDNVSVEDFRSTAD